MSSIKDDLFPDHRLVIQTVIYLVTLVVANYYIVKPALRLHNERKKRTSGSINLAREEEARADKLEASYEAEFRSKLDEVKKLRQTEVQAGQKEADKIFAEAQQKWEKHLSEVREQLNSNVVAERKRIPSMVDDIVKSVMSQLGASTIVNGFLLGAVALLASPTALAAEHGAFDSMSGIVWPYFQFLLFFSAVVYFGRKVINGILENRREALRVKLSEAKQALTLAQRRAAEFEKKMGSMQRELDELKTQFVSEGSRERQRLIEEAQTLANQMANDAQRTTKELVAKSKEELRREVVELALQTVESRLTPDLTRSLDKKLNSEAADGLRKLSAH